MKRILYGLSFVILLLTLGCKKENRVEKSKFTMKNNVLLLDGNKFTGIAYENYDEGGIKSEWTILNGIEHGPSTIYYSNGQINEIINWKDGEKDGPYE